MDMKFLKCESTILTFEIFAVKFFINSDYSPIILKKSLFPFEVRARYSMCYTLPRTVLHTTKLAKITFYIMSLIGFS